MKNLGVESDQAEQLADVLRVVFLDLKQKNCAIRVTDGDSKELYRTPFDPVPSWMRLNY